MSFVHLKVCEIQTSDHFDKNPNLGKELFLPISSIVNNKDFDEVKYSYYIFFLN